MVTSDQVEPAKFTTPHFGLEDFDAAYVTLFCAADTGALKVVLVQRRPTPERATGGS